MQRSSERFTQLTGQVVLVVRPLTLLDFLTSCAQFYLIKIQCVFDFICVIRLLYNNVVVQLMVRNWSVFVKSSHTKVIWKRQLLNFSDIEQKNNQFHDKRTCSEISTFVPIYLPNQSLNDKLLGLPPEALENYPQVTAIRPLPLSEGSNYPQCDD